MITFKIPAPYALATLLLGVVFWAGFLVGRNGAVEFSSDTISSSKVIELCPANLQDDEVEETS